METNYILNFLSTRVGGGEGEARSWRTSGKIQCFCMYRHLLPLSKGGMAMKAGGGREPFFRCQPLKAGCRAAGWFWSSHGSQAPTESTKERDFSNDTDPRQGLKRCDNSGFKIASLSVYSCARNRWFLIKDVGGKGQKGRRLFLYLQFPLLAEVSNAKIIGDQQPTGFGTHPRTFGSNLLPSLHFPWVHSKTGRIPQSLHWLRPGELGGTQQGLGEAVPDQRVV